MRYLSGMLNASEQIIAMQNLVQQQARTIEALEAQVFLLKEQLSWLQKQVFGDKSERIVADLRDQRPRSVGQKKSSRLSVNQEPNQHGLPHCRQT